jgi:diguanylate cyclase (GGDEF)-like protein/PAS domain S-box-containing protein
MGTCTKDHRVSDTSTHLDYRDIFERSATGVLRFDASGRIVECNRALARMLGFDRPEEVVAWGRLEFLNASDRELVLAALHDLGKVNNLEIPLCRADGTPLWICMNAARSEPVDGNSFYDAVVMEISEQRAAVDRFEYHSLHDPLTELPNRTLFSDRLTVALASARRKRKHVAVVAVEIDELGTLERNRGASAAERVFKRVAARLEDSVRLEDNVARLGESTFGLMLLEFGDVENCAVVVRRLLDSVATPFQVDGSEIAVSASAGIAMFPNDGATAEALIANAEEALDRALETGSDGFQFHQDALGQRALERTLLVGAIRRAIERHELMLVYQPELDTRTGRIGTVEALLRWNHPELGVIEPGRFLPMAESAHLTEAIGEWTLEEVCRQARAWQEKGIAGHRIAVNLSGRQFGKKDLLADLGRILRAAGVSPSIFQLEVSERAIGDCQTAWETLVELDRLGFHLAIDDFGSGRCSYHYLKASPADTLKVDRSFVAELPDSKADAAIVDGIITMANGLSCRVVAEGVETKQQMRFLQKHHCTEMQGFLFGTPLAASEMEDRLRHQH